MFSSVSDTSNQMEGFSVFYDNDGSETLLYNNIGVEYGTGVFTITINPPVITNAIIIRRTGILTLCEVEIFGSKREYTKIVCIRKENIC